MATWKDIIEQALIKDTAEGGMGKDITKDPNWIFDENQQVWRRKTPEEMLPKRPALDEQRIDLMNKTYDGGDTEYEMQQYLEEQKAKKKINK